MVLMITVQARATHPAKMCAVFRQFAGGGDAGAGEPFRAFLCGFLIAHEAGRWLQYKVDRRETILHANGNQASRIAVVMADAA
jgi:CO/xanthine dehydrogenase Mo-binding subunit